MTINHEIITLHGHRLAVGMAWKGLPGLTGQSREIAQLCAEAGVRHGTIVTTEDSVVVGLHDSPKKIASGAAWVALGSKGEALVLLEPVDKDRCWICAVRQNAPYPEFDLVVSNDRVVEILERLASVGSFTTVSRAYEGAQRAEDFSDLIEGKAAPLVKQLTGVQREVKIVGAVVGVAVVLGVGWMQYSHKREQQLAQEALAQLNASQAEEAKRAAELKRQQEMAAAELNVRVNVTGLPEPREMVAAWFAAIEGLPVTTAGWKLAKVTCDQTSCAAHWNRSALGTTREFLDQAAQRGWKVVAYQSENTTIALPVNSVQRNADPAAIQPEAAALPALMTSLQSMNAAGLQYSLAPAEQPRGEPTPNEPNGVLLASSPWKLGSFGLTGARLFEARDVPDYIAGNNLSLAAFSFDATTNQWTMEGRYAVK